MTISQLLRTDPAPFRGFVVDVISYPGYAALRLYRDNFEEFSEYQKALLLEWLNAKLELINQTTPCAFEIEAVMPRIEGK